MSLAAFLAIIAEKLALACCSDDDPIVERFVGGGDAVATMPLSSQNDSSWRLAGFPW